MDLTQKPATLVDRSTGECMLLRSPFVVVDIALRSLGIDQIKTAACTYDASWVHFQRLSTKSRKTTFATFGSISYLTPEASDCSYDVTAMTTASLTTVAPNNGMPWYKSCTAQALLKGAGTTALDAIGILPEGGTVSAAFSLFHGAAGVSNGIKIQQRVAFAAGIVSTAAAGSDLQGPQESTFSTTVTGLQATVGGFGIAKGFIEDIPVAGQAIAIGATAQDLVSTGLEVAKCY
jgi:hypothetical protein